MSQGAVIGALRGVLVLDASDWTPAINRARGDLSGLRGALEQVSRVMEDVGARARNVGAGLTAGLTLPLGALAVAANRSASGFEASMKRVEAALNGVSGNQLRQLADQAKDLGPRVGKGATEAADGIEALGLAGVSTADIMGGALKASLDLAAAGAAPVADAASLVTDSMGQFKVTAAQLPQVVGNVVGALDSSKFGFIDFQQAVAQGGGVAASAGLSFQDFATAIAATSNQFSSGSDAGTSFKTYIQSLVPVSKEAEYAMKQLGIEFFDVRTGRMKPLAEQAEILRKALGGLSDKSKTEALKTIFGSDAARTAIALMEKGRQGIVDLQAEIEKGDVGGKIAKRLEGEEAAAKRLANAFESVKIAIGEAGLTSLIAGVKNAVAGLLESFASAPPIILKIGVAFGAIAAATGPLVLILTQVAAFVLPLVAARFGLVGLAISALVNPIGTAVLLIGRFVSAFAQGAIIARVGVLLTSLLTPVGLVAAAVTLLTLAWQSNEAAASRSRAEQERLRGTMTGAKPALDKLAVAISELSGKTGDAAKSARDHASALWNEARAAVVAAQAIAKKRVAVAQMAATEAESYQKNANSTTFGASGAAAAGVVQIGARAMRDRADRARAEAKAAVDGLNEARGYLADLSAQARQTLNPASTRTVDLTPPGRTPAGRAGGQAGKYNGENRDQLRIQAELEVARARGDKAAEQRVQDQLNLSQQIEAYQRTGLTLDQARVAAQRDLGAIQQARAEAAGRETADMQATAALEVARLGTDQDLIDKLERQEDLKRRIAGYYATTLDLARATAMAEAEQARVDAARAAIRQQWFDDDARGRTVRLAHLRGESDERVRQLQREIDIRQRARDLEARNVAPAEALARATTEWDQEDRARMTGNVRATFQDGIRAAMDGNLGDFMKNWWRDRVAKGLEEAVNSLADLVSRLFANAGKGGGGGGGLFSGIGKVLGSVFGAASAWKGGGGIGAESLSIANDVSKVWTDLPKFRTGGSFKVGGMSGIDQNLIAFRATKGEMVDIRRPGNDNGGGGQVMVVPSPYFDVVAAEAAQPGIQAMGVRAAAGASQMARVASAKAARRRITR